MADYKFFKDISGTKNVGVVFKDIYCAGNDSVFGFLEDVLTEVMELFPSKYIHIGGDEVPKNFLTKIDHPLKEGFISLQSEGHPVQFRKIKIKELDYD